MEASFTVRCRSTRIRACRRSAAYKLMQRQWHQLSYCSSPRRVYVSIVSFTEKLRAAFKVFNVYHLALGYVYNTLGNAERHGQRRTTVLVALLQTARLYQPVRAYRVQHVRCHMVSNHHSCIFQSSSGLTNDPCRFANAPS